MRGAAAALVLLISSSYAGPVATLDTESFVGSERSWGIIRMGYSQILPARLKEIAGSMPGRFVPKADVEVLDRMRGGHFLKIVCNAGTDAAVECPDKRAEMEARVVAAVFLEAAPKTRMLDELVDKENWKLTPLGRRTIQKVEKRCPDFWERLKKMTESVLGVEKDTP